MRAIYRVIVVPRILTNFNDLKCLFCFFVLFYSLSFLIAIVTVCINL